MMFYVGIDVGKTGAIAVIDNLGKLVFLKDFIESVDIIKKIAGKVSHAYIEEVHSMPKQGVASTFSFGENFGWWKGILQGYSIPFSTIRPQAWQKGLTPNKKSATDKPSLIIARQMFPDAELSLKKHHNRADAILIAYVCYQHKR